MQLLGASSDSKAPDVALREFCSDLLISLFEDHRAESAFFLLRPPPEPADRTLVPLQVVAAHSAGGERLEHPDYHLDHHYLRDIAALDGAHHLAGAEEGISRPLLSCSFALIDDVRGVVLLEGSPGGDSLADEDAEKLEESVAAVVEDLRALYRISEQAQKIERLSSQLEELAGLLDQKELELGGIRRTLEEERFLGEEVTCYHRILTRSPRMQEIFNYIERIKDTDLSVLVSGETGTGKELIARAIHYGGNRADHPFEVIPCGSLSQNLLESELFGYRKGSFSGADEDRKGIFERANGGTVFLDEVADMTMEMQQKLLRVLQEQMVRPIGAETPVRVDVRVISSSQRELSALVDSRGFREDLFYRLNGFTLEVPPLRERREDIPLLIDHFLAEACDENDLKKRFSESALRELYQYSWPGNVQELCNVITRSILSSPRKIISRKVVLPLLSRGTGNLFYGEDLFQDGDHLHLRIPTCEGFNEIITECERLILVTALKRHRGNKSRVTQQLGIPRQTLYNKLEKFAVGEEEYLETE